jgi:hypothetical protein
MTMPSPGSTSTSKRRLAVILSVILAAAQVSCGSGDGDPADASRPVLFHFKLHGQLASEDFRAYISSPAAKAAARAQLALPVAQRKLHAVGLIGHGTGGFNLGWNWHFRTMVVLEAVSIELCDTTPSLIAADVATWAAASTGACPWSSYVFAEVQ